MRGRLLILTLLSVPLGGSRCSSQGTSACRTSAECGANRICDVASGLCMCANDRGCGEGEFCNSSRQCQPMAGCQDNTDCELQASQVPLFCNILTARCEVTDQCFSDTHCKQGMICDSLTRACAPGCRDEADCLLGQGCLRDPPEAPIGQCTTGACSRSDQCKPGWYCDLATRACVPDQRGPFCGPCTRFDPTDPQCGDPANYCLIDTGDPTRRGHYCGVDCSQDQGCPNGYECKRVILVGPPATPACGIESCVNNVCSNTGAPCTTSFDCPEGLPGGDCPRAHQGVCAGTLGTECTSDAECGGAAGSCRFSECRQREQSAYGFCSCVIDTDCPTDDCRGADLTVSPPIPGHCFLSGHR